ncbi:Clathrin light chain [Mycoemilia scoparia]|uniref:Clathrin light chain n=1 Tax=Mycoemilia scoparia TaxID=417184 RepID=A0A9W7ZYH2_9FUNG|nr:Clathrin light chain [Mycoemilia scoparia]
MSDDPVDDFLAREREALGEDADFFQNSASLPATSTSPAAAVDMSNSIDFPPFEAVSNDVSNLNLNELNSTSPVNSSLNVDGRSSTDSPFNGGSSQNAQLNQPNDSEFLSEWREKQKQVVEERDKDSQKRHDEILQKARDDIDKFYDEYNEKKEKSINENRANQVLELQQITTGNLWERVVRQIDLASKHVSAQATDNDSAKSPSFSGLNSGFSQSRTQSPFPQSRGASSLNNASDNTLTPKTRDTTRMRELLQDLKKDPKAPGVEVKN